jgi:hypothetical protein
MTTHFSASDRSLERRHRFGWLLFVGPIVLNVGVTVLTLIALA